MNARLAARFVVIALFLFIALMVASLVLNNARQRQVAQQLAPATSDPLQIAVSLDTMLMKLDANGNGSQVISGTHVSVAISPYPVQASLPITLLVVGTNVNGQITPITPTLFVSPAEGGNEGDVLQVDLRHDEAGAYIASQPFVPAAGIWRLRVHFYLNEADTSDIIFNLEAP